MATVSLPGFFDYQQFTDAGEFAEAYRLYTYTAGTTTHADAYTESTGTTVHTYVSDGIGGTYIALDARGELPAPLFFPAGAYDVTLKTSAGATVKTRRAIAVAASTVSSVNSETGAVVLDAGDIGYTTGVVAAWFSGTDVELALDDIITEINTVKTSVTAVSAVPSQTGKSGQYLTTDGATASWAGPWSHMLSVADGSATSRSVLLNAGTWELTLLFNYFIGEGDDVNVIPVQTASVDTITGTATATQTLTSGSTDGVYFFGGAAVGKATLTVASTGSYTFRITAATSTNTSASTVTFTGSIAYLQRTA